MPSRRKPRIWNAFIVPSALGIFYCIMLCLSYPHLVSDFPTHFNAAGSPDRWQTTGPVLLATMVVIATLFLIFGIWLIYSSEKRWAWFFVGISYAGIIGVTVGASLEFVHALLNLQAPHVISAVLTTLAWGVGAVIAEFLFLLIPRWPLHHTADRT